MQKEVTDPVIAKIMMEYMGNLPSVPDNLKVTYAKPAGLSGAALLGTGGFIAGTHLGIAGFFGAISGALPLAAALGLIGYFGFRMVGGKVEKTDGDDDPCSDEV